MAISTASEVINGFIEFAYADPDGEAGLMKLLALGIDLRIIQPESGLFRALAGPRPKAGGKQQSDQLSVATSEMKEIQAAIRSFLELLSQNLDKDLQFEFQIGCNFIWQPELVFRHHSGESGAVTATIREAGATGRDEGRVAFPSYMLRFLVALDEKRKSAFGHCSRCGRLFFNDTNRRKLYCGLRCQNADAVDKARMKRKEG
jgi:hypothetical protein